MRTIEPLEPRRLLAFSSLVPDSRRLLVSGTQQADNIVVSRDEPAARLQVTLNGVTESYPLADVLIVRIDASGGNDTVFIDTRFKVEVFAGDGDDFVRGGGGSETMHGGAGTDTLDGGGGNDLLVEAESAENLDNDNDSLYGRGGNDQFVLGGGDDVVDGGSGDRDLANYNFHNDRLQLSLDGTPNDGTRGSAGGNVRNIEHINAGEGRDLIVGSSKNETLNGGGSDGADTIFGKGGDDLLSTVAAGSLMDGGSGDDILSGRNCTALGQSGDDQITLRTGDGSGPPDEPNGGRVEGGTGRDTIEASGFAYSLNGNGDVDAIYWNIDPALVTQQNLTGDVSGGGGRDVIVLQLIVPGGVSPDAGFSATFDDQANDGVAGVGGQINFRSDIEIINGSEGRDTLDASARPGGTQINGHKNDDSIIGSAFADYLIGDNGADTLIGGAGEDRLSGDRGPDSLVGGPGPDVLHGGFGYDILEAADGEADTVNGAQGLGDSADVDELLDTLIRVESTT